VTLRLEDDLDISCGDLVCRPGNQPDVIHDLDAMMCWMDDRRVLTAGEVCAKAHHTFRARMVKEFAYRLDVNTLHREESVTQLGLNDIRRIPLRTTHPRLADAYSRNRQTGGFILIDEVTNATVAAGMIIG
jgi:bifunctional enzyme CysN/CysC